MLQLVVIAIVVLAGIAIVFYGSIGFRIGESLRCRGKLRAVKRTTSPLPTTQWTFMYSGRMTGDPANFTFPNFDGVHYCLKGAAGSGIAIGKTITFRFELAGDGDLKVADPTDTAPATVRLILQRKGDNLTQADYRFWYGKTNLVNGILTMTAPIDPQQWTNVYGAVNPAGFQALIGDIANVGFTFGGQSFAGHGVYCPTGTRTFKLLEYSVA